MREIKFFNRRNKGLNIDITHRCALECPRCQRQTQFRDRGQKVYGVDISFCLLYTSPSPRDNR